MLFALFALSALANALPLPLPDIRVALLPSRPRLSAFQDGYRVLSSVVESRRADQSQLVDAEYGGRLSVEAHELTRPLFVGGTRLDLHLSNPAHEDPFDFCIFSGKTSPKSLTGCSFVVHLAVPDDFAPIPTIPYMVTPPLSASPDQLRAYWEHWRLTPSHIDNTYAFNYGQLHVVVLDTGASPDDLLYWLKVDLANLNRELSPFVVVVGTSELPADLRSEFDDVLAVHDVDALVLGVKPGKWIKAHVDSAVQLKTLST